MMDAMLVEDGRTPYAEAARVAVRKALRDTLFGAARDLLQQRGAWSEVSMADVASAAGVSRQTLYKTFGNRNAFAQALVIHEGERFLDVVESAVRENAGDPRAAIQKGVEAFLARAADDPLVAVLLRDDGTSGALPFLTTQGLPVVLWAASRLTRVIRDIWPLSAEHHAELLGESVVRLAISYLTAPRASAGAMAAAATELVGPFVDGAIGTAAELSAGQGR
jgi:AcrR family transcriptional regulator